MAEARTTQQRVQDARNKLEQGGDAWLATADGAGPHLVPLSLAWDSQKEEIIFCTVDKNRTSRNIEEQSSVRVALGTTRDVVMIYGDAEVIGAVGDYQQVVRLFSAKTGWNPSRNSGNWIFIRVSPIRIQAWREVNEMQGRTIMKNGQWLE